MSAPNVQSALQAIRNGKDVAARTAAAEHLERIMRATAPESVDDDTLHQVIVLLDSNEESVRAAVAAALGDLGPRARLALPKLLAILPKDCPVFGLSSSGAIRLAIQRIGAVPPPPPPCQQD